MKWEATQRTSRKNRVYRHWRRPEFTALLFPPSPFIFCVESWSALLTQKTSSSSHFLSCTNDLNFCIYVFFLLWFLKFLLKNTLFTVLWSQHLIPDIDNSNAFYMRSHVAWAFVTIWETEWKAWLNSKNVRSDIQETVWCSSE